MQAARGRAVLVPFDPSARGALDELAADAASAQFWSFLIY
jgi:hypothetical protein